MYDSYKKSMTTDVNVEARVFSGGVDMYVANSHVRLTCTALQVTDFHQLRLLQLGR
jgi:hypothetical protein